jgi:hypothetical protein
MHHHQCEHCQGQFASAEELKRHRAERHADQPVEPEEVRREELLATGTNLTEQSGTHPPPGRGGPATP